MPRWYSDQLEIGGCPRTFACDIAGFEFTSSETGAASGMVELLDGEVTEANATAPYTVTFTTRLYWVVPV